jgi:GH15 family glucan-1,4-alpha-glucosidase
LTQDPIASYALLSDCQGAALVSDRGAVDWACFERFDAPSVFGQLLGPGGGVFSVHPIADAEVEREYLDGTLVLRTEFRTPEGSFALTDALALGDLGDPGGDPHAIGRHVPHMLLRSIEGLSGTVEVEVVIAPRPEYGLTVPRMVPVPGGWRTVGGPTAAVISSPVDLHARSGRLLGQLRIQAGERVGLSFHVHSPWAPPPSVRSTDAVIDLLDDTISRWTSWSALHLDYDGAHRDLVLHSGRVLQALTYAPSGAMIAAPTTSLPEVPGGERNWDYRYCWVRDASLTLEALWVAACPHEAGRFFDFLATAAGSDASTGCGALQILYGVGGERFVPESTLDHLDGHRGARPVRVGNGAWNQTQLDVYGELLSAACTLAEQIGDLSAGSRDLLVDAADTAARRWPEPDQGIWEIRGEPRHFLYSKLMCWVALDRAVRLGPLLAADVEQVEHWARNRDTIRAQILEKGWNPETGAFTQSYGSTALDAANLMMPIVGFLPADDPRMAATVEAIRAGLTDARGLVYRYRSDDGLDGDEGTFLICTFWLVQCLALSGRTVEANELFERAAGHMNDVSLLAEEVDPLDGSLLGNFPSGVHPHRSRQRGVGHHARGARRRQRSAEPR